jgi:RES domain-containing protein
MPTKFNPRFGEIAADLRDQGGELLCPWEGDCWRFQAVSHPRGRDILSGKGALQNGGRWNAPGAFPVVYGSTSGAVALEESEANGRYYGIISRNARIYVCIHLNLSRVLDLTNARTQRRLKLVAKHLVAEDWRKINADGHESLTQCVGRAAHTVGAECVLAPAASVKGGITLAYFPANRGAGSSVVLHDAAAIAVMLGGRRE